MAFDLTISTDWGFDAGFWKLDWFEVKRDEDSVTMQFHCYKDKATCDAGGRPVDSRNYATDVATFVDAVQASQKANPLAAIIDACETLAQTIRPEDWSEATGVDD